MTRARSFFVALALVVFGAPLFVADPAAADCGGPTIEYDAGEVQRGESVSVRGVGWGHECYDTGPPPPGEGTLGEPIQEIEVLVTQDGSSTILARGSADGEYRFEVDVVVPTWLEPGEARLSARWVGGAAADATDAPIVVTDEAALPGADGSDLVRFGPADAEEGLSTLAAPEDDDAGVDAAPAPADDRGGDGGTSSDPLFVLWLVLAAAGGAAVAMVVCLRRTTTVTTASRIDP